MASGPFPLGPLGVSHAECLNWQLASPGPMDVGSFLDLRESTGPPAAPPTKRHCRSLSEPEELARCRSPWRPGSSKVWTPISKRRCNSGGSATLQCCSALGSPALRGRSGLPRSSVSPPMPRPASASSGFVDGSEGSASSGPPWLSAGPCPFSSRRRLSLSQEHLVDANTCLPSASSTPTSTPELGRHHGLLRCRSQPCVLDGRRVRRKRRREEDARWMRPSLDFLKMTRVRLCSVLVAGSYVLPCIGLGVGWLWPAGLYSYLTTSELRCCVRPSCQGAWPVPADPKTSVISHRQSTHIGNLDLRL